MGLYKRGEVWWMRFNNQGQQVRQSTETTDKRMAEAILGKIRAQIVEGKWFEVDQARQHAFDELMEKFMEEHAPKQEMSTQKRYQVSLKHLHPFFGGLLLSDITAEYVSDYITQRIREGAKPATINRERDLLSKAFNLAWKQWEWVRENPCMKVPKLHENNTVDRWLTKEEEERLMLRAQGYLNGQLVEIITVTLHTGMRESEIVSLRWRENIDLFRKTIMVTKTKNKEPKVIPMTNEVFEILFKKSKVRAMSGYVFTTSIGTPYCVRFMIKKFDKAIKEAGIERFTFHCLRHTAATRLTQSGVDLNAISKILGHKDIRSTLRYAHHYSESLRPAISILDNFSAKSVGLALKKC